MSQAANLTFTTPVSMDPAVTESRVFVPQRQKDGIFIWKQRIALAPNADPSFTFTATTSGTGVHRSVGTFVLPDYETQTLATLGNKVPYITVQVITTSGGDVRDLLRFRAKHLVLQALYSDPAVSMLLGTDEPT